jgi:hypothetical protein
MPPKTADRRASVSARARRLRGRRGVSTRRRTATASVSGLAPQGPASAATGARAWAARSRWRWSGSGAREGARQLALRPCPLSARRPPGAGVDARGAASEGLPRSTSSRTSRVPRDSTTPSSPSRIREAGKPSQEARLVRRRVRAVGAAGRASTWLFGAAPSSHARPVITSRLAAIPRGSRLTAHGSRLAARGSRLTKPQQTRGFRRGSNALRTCGNVLAGDGPRRVVARRGSAGTERSRASGGVQTPPVGTIRLRPGRRVPHVAYAP